MIIYDIFKQDIYSTKNYKEVNKGVVVHKRWHSNILVVTPVDVDSISRNSEWIAFSLNTAFTVRHVAIQIWFIKLLTCIYTAFHLIAFRFIWSKNVSFHQMIKSLAKIIYYCTLTISVSKTALRLNLV